MAAFKEDGASIDVANYTSNNQFVNSESKLNQESS